MRDVGQRRDVGTDRPIEADWVSVGIDARGDGRTAIELKVNAAGVLSDAIRFDDTDLDQDWDETWEASVARTPRGWSTELRVPLRILRFSTANERTSWGLQVRRYTSLARETDELREDRSLHLARRVIVMVVEPHLAGRHHPGVAERRGEPARGDAGRRVAARRHGRSGVARGRGDR